MILGADYRLIVHAQFALFHRPAQIRLDLIAGLCPVTHVHVVEAVAALALVLRPIQRKVSSLDQFFRFDPVKGRDRNTDRRSDGYPGIVHLIWLRNHFDKAISEFAQFGAVVDILQHDLEFIAAQAADFALVADNAFDPVCNLLQQVVAGRVTVRVVHLLEAIEIQHEQRAASLRCVKCFQRRCQPLGHTVTVCQPGQRIVLGHPFRI